MKNKLTDLNDHLFAQLERLSDDALTGETIAFEVTRSEAIVLVASKIVDSARAQLAAMELVAEHRDLFAKGLPMLGVGSPEVKS